jgi:exodeoxyribonuclease VII large subunit
MSRPNILEQLTRQRKPLSVSELTARIKMLIERQFVDIWVHGEISNFRKHSSGHWYFTLKDESASLNCACFRMQNRLIRFNPADGLTVRARGKLSVHEDKGEYRLLIEFMEPAGLGAQQLAFEQLKAKLAAEGLFESARKRKLPMLPRRIGVVTSRSGAAIVDILRILRRRNEKVSVLVAPAKVQGEGAATQVAAAITALNEFGAVDVIIVGRGGGRSEDLSAFNEEIVARAIHRSPAPVISAVGHETDFTIADFVADLRASTPSAAAEMVAAAREELDHRMKSLRERMTAAVNRQTMRLRGDLSRMESARVIGRMPIIIRAFARRFDEAVNAMESAASKAIRGRRTILESMGLRLREADPRRVLGARRAGLVLFGSRMDAAIKTALGRQRERLSVAAGKLDSMSPLAVLSRGYAIAFDTQGRIVKQKSMVNSGDALRVRVSDGDIECTVD